MKGKVIQRHDIPSLLTAIFEVSVTKHTDLGLLPSNSSSNGGGPHPNESYQISPDLQILSSEQSNLSHTASHLELLVGRNGVQKIKSDRSHKSRQPKQKNSHLKSRAAPWHGNLISGGGNAALIDTDYREKIIAETAAALDIESFKSVLDYLPNEMRQRIAKRETLERLAVKEGGKVQHKWSVFREETEEDVQDKGLRQKTQSEVV